MNIKDLSLAICIPCHNNSWNLRIIFESIKNQTVQPNEIIVTNDNSSSTEVRFIKALCRDYKALFCSLDNPKTYLESTGRRSHARNLATNLSKSDLLLYLDGDMVLDSNYLKEIKNFHELDSYLLLRGQNYELPIEEQKKGIVNVLYYVSSYPYLIAEKNLPNYIHIDDNNNTISEISLGALSLFLFEEKYSKINRRSFMGIMTAYFCLLVSSHSLFDKFSLYSDDWQKCISNNLSVRNIHVKNIGGWDEQFFGWGEEDIDFSYRLYKSGLHPFIPIGTRTRAFHLTHDLNHDMHRITLIRNARYFISKYPEMLGIRFPVYESIGIKMDELVV